MRGAHERLTPGLLVLPIERNKHDPAKNSKRKKFPSFQMANNLKVTKSSTLHNSDLTSIKAKIGPSFSQGAAAIVCRFRAGEQHCAKGKTNGVYCF